MSSEEFEGIIELTEQQQDDLVDDCVTCWYCHEPFKECDTLIPGNGVIDGDIDVVQYKPLFWHHGCIEDWHK